MCTFTEPDQEAAQSAPSAAPLSWVSFWELDPLSLVVGRTEDPHRESRIPGHNVGKLTLLLYPIVLPGCL